MKRFIGKIGNLKIVECRGMDALRGVIGRERMLQDHVFVFRNCPMIHTFCVQNCIWVTFIYNKKIAGQEIIKPWRLSGFYQYRSLCLESSQKLTKNFVEEILDLM